MTDRPAPTAAIVDDLRNVGFHIAEGAIPPAVVAEAKERLYRVRDAVHAEVGEHRLRAAGEVGVLRAPLRHDPWFARFLEVPEILAVVDAYVAPTAVLHLQNGFILPSVAPAEQTPAVFQTTFHRDFPRYMEGYVASVNALIAFSGFTRDTGATLVVPGSHQRADRPSDECIARRAVSAECPAGSILFFDSTLWHAAGRNTSGADRLAMNMQFTRSFLKQQIDLVRHLGPEAVLALPPRSQQLVGWYTRVPSSLDEYYRAPAERLYRGGQG